MEELPCEREQPGDTGYFLSGSIYKVRDQRSLGLLWALIHNHRCMAAEDQISPLPQARKDNESGSLWQQKTLFTGSNGKLPVSPPAIVQLEPDQDCHLGKAIDSAVFGCLWIFPLDLTVVVCKHSACFVHLSLSSTHLLVSFLLHLSRVFFFPLLLISFLF